MSTRQNLYHRALRLAAERRKKHYKVDDAKVRARTRRDPQEETAEVAAQGFYTYNVYEVIPLSRVKPTKVWKQRRIDRVVEAIDRGIPLPPVELTETRPGQYQITDGIHRYNASLEAGFTHIPAILPVFVDVEPEPDVEIERKPEYAPRTWIEFHDPVQGYRTGYLLELVSRGPEANRYSIVAGDDQSADYVGDYPDTSFEVVDARRVPPATRENILGHWWVEATLGR